MILNYDDKKKNLNQQGITNRKRMNKYDNSAVRK